MKTIAIFLLGVLAGAIFFGEQSKATCYIHHPPKNTNISATIDKQFGIGVVEFVATSTNAQENCVIYMSDY